MPHRAPRSAVRPLAKRRSPSGLYQSNTQVYQTVDGKNQFIKNVSQLAGAWVDTADYPASGGHRPGHPGQLGQRAGGLRSGALMRHP